MTAVVVAVLAIGLVLLFLLTQATDHRELYEKNYAHLFFLNMAVASILFAIIFWIAFRLYTRFKKGRFGSRLLVKLAAIFALSGLLPGVLIYVVSYQFVSRSIETWFDVKVEAALDAGLNLGRVSLDTLSGDLATKTRASSVQIAQISDSVIGLSLERLREQLGASDVVLWSASGQLIAESGESRYSISPIRPTQQQFRNARAETSIVWIDGLEDLGQGTVKPGRIIALAMVASPLYELKGAGRFLQVVKPLAPNFVANALAVADANREYQGRSLARDGLKRMYIGTLTLSLFLAVFGSVLVAVLLGNQIVRPLLVLADGVNQVAAGDLTPKLFLQANDELGGLTRSFADMTNQLASARRDVERSMHEVSTARGRLQTILDNLTTGVVVLNGSDRVVSANPGACRILGAALLAHLGEPLGSVPGLGDVGDRIKQQFEAHQKIKTDTSTDHWEASFGMDGKIETGQHAGIHGGVMLMVRGAILPDGDQLLVFDDISGIISAQRTQAWGEVARRLAHEIKNPLTPIQLSAERLERKLGHKVSVEDSALLSRYVRTIVDQVDAMKRLVDEFRDYSRLPGSKLIAMSLNELIVDVLQLYGDAKAEKVIEMVLDSRDPVIMGDPERLRQVVHNLLQNAMDAASEKGSEVAKHSVVIASRCDPENDLVWLTVSDTGTGFADSVMRRAFEPYVTTKTKGTGLGLAMVKKIADEHGAKIELANKVAGAQVSGALVSLIFPRMTSAEA